ncbi:MAG TPA: hypothetical protein VGK40_12890 [Verrucomicrobiae bacterium]
MSVSPAVGQQAAASNPHDALANAWLLRKRAFPPSRSSSPCQSDSDNSILEESLGIVARRANILVLVVVLVLVIETKATEDENEDEEEFGCGSAALWKNPYKKSCHRPTSRHGAGYTISDNWVEVENHMRTIDISRRSHEQ